MTTYKISRHNLVDLLTTAALVGQSEIPSTACTRGDVTAVVERRMERQLSSIAEHGSTPADLVPTQINGYRVTDAVRASSLDSNLVHVIAEDERGERVVWDCYRDSFGAWAAQNGAYGRSRSWALGVLVQRLGWGTEADGYTSFTLTD